MRCQACSRDQFRFWDSDSEPKMKILRISEEDCSMIRFTAAMDGYQHQEIFMVEGGSVRSYLEEFLPLRSDEP